MSKYPYRFRRQVTCGSFIMDFYCAAAKLAIELDGSQHDTWEGMAYDRDRSACLQTQGTHILRFSNMDVLETLNGVCQTIDAAETERIK